jgi:ComF family protein
MDPFLYRVRSIGTMLIDAILPRPERRVRAERLTPEDLAISPVTHSLLGTDITTLCSYADVRDVIQALKYDRSEQSAHLLSRALAEYLHEDIAARKLMSNAPVYLIPVPLDAKRKRDRGYNQIGLVVDSLPEEFKNGTLARIAAPMLERIRETRAQTSLPRTERLTNVSDAFAASSAELLDGAYVYLIDDVATTGATLVNAARPLEAAGATVQCLALARA